LIDLNPPPEYAPPVPPHDIDELTPEFIVGPRQHIHEMPSHELSTPRGLHLGAEANHDATVEENIEDEDPEVEFYKEMRQQEEERRQRLARPNN
jgi:hypothetical protein